jgi:hypothetical protein
MAIYESGVSGLNELLRDFRKLGKEAAKELRASSKTIAEQHMVPAWKNAALQYAGPWGQRYSQQRTGRVRPCP